MACNISEHSTGRDYCIFYSKAMSMYMCEFCVLYKKIQKYRIQYRWFSFQNIQLLRSPFLFTRMSTIGHRSIGYSTWGDGDLSN